MNIVIDVNDFISALIGKSHRNKLNQILFRNEIVIYADLNLISEIREVAFRSKFRKYVSKDITDIYIDILSQRLTMIKTTTIINDCNDPDDNYLLSLAIDSKSSYIITGDKKDLLSLNPYKEIQILRLDEFLKLLEK